MKYKGYPSCVIHTDRVQELGEESVLIKSGINLFIIHGVNKM